MESKLIQVCLYCDNSSSACQYTVIIDLVADLDSVLQRAFDIGISKVLAFKHNYNIYVPVCVCMH